MSSDSNDTRTKILRATWDQLEAEPSKMPRMSDIAKRAGISRQALYLHFENRTEMLAETTRYQDQENNAAAHFAPSRDATVGRVKLDAIITTWSSYMPKIWGVARALFQLAETEPEAKEAIEGRMKDVREGFENAILALQRDGDLPAHLDVQQATDLLETLMHIRNWDRLVNACGWSQDCYADTMRAMAHALILQETEAITQVLACPEPHP